MAKKKKKITQKIAKILILIKIILKHDKNNYKFLEQK